VTVTVCPPMTMVAVRATPVPLSAAVNVTAAVPRPLPTATASQLAFDAAVQAQLLSHVIDTVPLPPAGLATMLVAESA